MGNPSKKQKADKIRRQVVSLLAELSKAEDNKVSYDSFGLWIRPSIKQGNDDYHHKRNLEKKIEFLNRKLDKLEQE